MEKLINGCSCGKISVTPKNWEKAGACIKKYWQIQFYFYDPSHPKKKKQCVFKGMNEYHTLQERRAATKVILAEIKQMLVVEGYNPITNTFTNFVGGPGDIDPNTSFIKALELAVAHLKSSIEYIKNVESAIKYIKQSAAKLGFLSLRICEVRRKHVSLVLDGCRNVKERWSPSLFNHYRTYLMSLFKVLVKMEAIQFNPVDNYLSKEIEDVRPRRLPNDEEVKKILNELSKHPNLYRFFQIFFHSGSRPVELLRMKYEDVDMDNEVFRIKVKKGNRIKIDERAIKRIAVPYWKELYALAKPNDYIFGSKLVPGTTFQTRDHITRMWHKIVKHKDALNINVDLYTFKHKNLDEIATYLSIKEAQKAAGHGSPVITMTYAIGEKKREMDRLRHVPNALGG